MSKKVLFGIVAVIILSTGLYLFIKMSDTRSASAYIPAPAPITPVTGPITMDMVATHGSQTSCWSVIDSNIYDLTSWISNHPGGEGAILSICGKDGTQAFHGQHGDSKRQADMLATFKIGTLAK